MSTEFDLNAQLAKSWVSTTIYSKAYLAHAWPEFGVLNENERFGFGQFAYLTMCGHIEGFFIAAIRARIRTVRRIMSRPPYPLLKSTIDGRVVHEPSDAAYEALSSMVNNHETKMCKLTMSTISTEHDLVFQKSLKEIVGSTVMGDLKALEGLRNVLAHGRDFSWDIRWMNDGANIAFQEDGTIAQSLQAMSNRLKILKLLRRGKRTFQDVVFSEKAICHFLSAVNEIELKVRDNLLEIERPQVDCWSTPLPQLHPKKS